MDTKTTRYFLIFILVSSLEAEDVTNNDSLFEELQQRQASGRMVKLYSGKKPEPFLCTSDGFQADPNDCAIFYRCVKSGNGKYSVFKFRCGPGTVYDPDTEVCNHPSNTKRSECGGLKRPSADINDNDVNEIEEAQQEIPSPISTKLPVYTERTTTIISFAVPDNSSQKHSSTDYNSYGPSTISSLSTNNQGSSSGPTLTTVPLALTETSSVSTAHPWATTTKRAYTHYASTSQAELTSSGTNQLNSNNMICTFDGFIGDSENCHKFYRCVRNQKGGYTKYEFSCSESTIWDDDIQSCNHPWAVKRSRCGKSSVYNINSSIPNALDTEQETTTPTNPHIVTNKTIQHQVQISHGSKVSQNQIQISKGPSIQNQTQINYGDNVNKTKYSTVKQNQTQISYGSAVSQVQTQINNENEVVQTQLQIDHVEGISQTQIQKQESSTDNTTTSNSSHMCTESGFIHDPNDCKKFYRCVNNGRGGYTQYEFSCGEGTVWDAKMEACNHAWLVKECGHKVITSPVIQEVLSTSSMKSTQNYDTMTTVTSHNYYTTSENITTKGFEDVGYGSGMHDTTISSIITLNTTTFDSTKVKENECMSSGFIGDTKDCTIFYRCVEDDKGGYIKHEFKCGEGTVWDPDIDACNHAWAVKKCGGNAQIDREKMENATTSTTSKTTISSEHTTESIIQVTEQIVQHDDSDTGYGSQNDELSSTTIKTTKQPQIQGENESNECQSSGFMSDRQNCKKFYRCVDNGSGSYTRYEFTCGEGTVWDSELEGCNYEWAVKECSSKNTSTSVTPADFITSNVNSTEHYNPTSTKTTIYYTTTSLTVPNTTISQSSAIETTTEILQLQENECQSSGFMGDTKDCKIFYRCVKNGDGGFTKYEFKCGEGTVWDPDIEACNHAWAVKNCGGIASINNETVESTTINSANTTNTNLQSTGQIIQHDDYDTGYNANEDQFSSTSIKTTETPQNHDNSLSNECVSSGFMVDMQDCKKFYRCVDSGNGSYIRYEFTCGEGTVWDPKIQACNHGWAVENCSSSGPAAISDTSHHNHTTAYEEIGVSYSTQSGIHSDTSTINSITSSTTVKTITSNDDNTCSSSGFVGDSKDCKKFYRCVNNGDGSYSRHEFMCGEGTYWNQNITACDHMSQDHPCGDNESTTKESEHESDEMLIESTTKTTTLSVTIAEQTSSVHSSQNICEAEGFYGDFNDCKKFYRCVDNGNENYTKYDFTCGDGTMWNQEIQACDHISSNNKCIPVLSSTETIEFQQDKENYTTAVTTTTQAQQSTQTTNTVTSTSNNRCESEGFHADSSDCKKFIRCVSNPNGGYTEYEFTCGEGTIWVQDIQACDYDTGLESCGSQYNYTIKPQPTESQQSFTTSEIIYTTSTAQTNMPAKEDDEYNSENSKEPGSSSAECSSEGFYADPNDCKKFYRCVENDHGQYIKYDFSCGEDTAWDGDIQACNHISQVRTCKNSDTQDSQIQPIMHDESVSQTTENTSTSKSSTLAETNESTSTTKSSTLSETNENVSTTKSSTLSESNEDTSTSQDACEKEGYYGNTKSCKLFYRCVDDGKGGFTKYEYSCGDGTIWDQDITACNHPQDVVNPSCNRTEENTSTSLASSSSTTSTTPSNEISESTTSTTENSEQTSQNCTQDQSSNNTQNKNITCSKAGYYAHPNDCKKFYRCVDWDGDGKRFSVYYFDCGEGTIWDPAVETCNHEESVYPPRDCSGAQSQNENMGSSTTTETVTTIQSTTIDETAGQQPATEQTTISAETTTQQSTSTESSSTQQSSTSEETTTQQTITSDQTTQQSSTSAQSTTQQPTSTEKTTTQQSSTSEQTTTQQTTASELTTTQQTSTSEQTTTQASTSSEQTSVKPSSEETTTESYTTSQQTTTDHASTIDSSSNEASTTTTTEGSTSTTSQSSDTTSTTEGSTSTTTQSSDTTSTTEGSTSTTSQSSDTTSTTERSTSTTSQSSDTTSITTQSSDTTSTTEGSTSTTTQSSDTTSTTEGSTSTTSQSSDTTSTTEGSTSTTTQSSDTTSTTEGSTSTTTQSSDTTSTTVNQQETTTNATSNSECPDADSDQNLFVCPTSFRRHPKYCNLFYQCTEEDDSHEPKIALFTCPNNTIYDESKVQCVEEDKADKPCKGEVATKRRFKRVGANFKYPIVVTRESQRCPAIGHMPFEKNSECSIAFLKCEKTKSGKLRGLVHQCPQGYIYWSISRRCERIDNVRNCTRSTNNWDNRWEIPFERNNVAW